MSAGYFMTMWHEKRHSARMMAPFHPGRLSRLCHAALAVGGGKDFLILSCVLLLSAALAFAMLTKGHDWGDDFAAYIGQAISILHGTMRQAVMRNAFTMRESSRAYAPIAAPWGYPALLAAAYLVCGGLNIFCLKLLNIPAFALFLVVFFRFVRRRLSRVDSTIVLSVLAFNSELLLFLNNILSDITFLFSRWGGILPCALSHDDASPCDQQRLDVREFTG